MIELIQQCLESLARLFKTRISKITEESKPILAIEYLLCFCANRLVQEHDIEIDRRFKLPKSDGVSEHR